MAERVGLSNRVSDSNEIYRFDKNIVSNFGRIESLVEQNSSHKISGLVRTLLCFFSWEYQHNLFFGGVLYPDKFAKEYNLNIKDLVRKCENPYQLEDMSESDIARLYKEEAEGERSVHQGEISGRLWDSVLENALYVLSHRTISIQATGGFYTDETGSVVKGTVGIQVLKAVICERRGQALVYRYVLNPDFVRNLTGYFINANRALVCSLRPKHLDKFYMNLVNLKNNLLACEPPRYKTDADNTPSFEVLCAWADIPKYTKEGNEYPPKKRKGRLNDALKVMIEEAHLLSRVEWISLAGDSTAAYVPCLYFSAHEAKPDIVRMNKRIEFKTMFKEELSRHLFDRFREICIYTNNGRRVSEENFYEWLESRENEEEKRNAFETAYFIAYKRVPVDNEEFIKIQTQFHNRIRFGNLEV